MKTTYPLEELQTKQTNPAPALRPENTGEKSVLLQGRSYNLLQG